jgi:sialic acid synthase SpsE
MMMVMMMMMSIAAVAVVIDVSVAAVVIVVVVIIMMEAFFTYIVGASRHTVAVAVSIAAGAMRPYRIFRLFVFTK